VIASARHDLRVSLRLEYLIFLQALGLILLMGRTSAAKDVELLVLWHEVAVLRRTNPRPRMMGRPGRLRRPHPAAAPNTAMRSPGNPDTILRRHRRLARHTKSAPQRCGGADVFSGPDASSAPVVRRVVRVAHHERPPVDATQGLKDEVGHFRSCCRCSVSYKWHSEVIF
jgi:hypothetical protein